MKPERRFDEKSILLDCKATSRLLEGFIRSELHKAGFTRGVIGVSGGVDSALSAAISAKALGPENVLGVILPYKTSNPDSTQDAYEVAEYLGIRTREIDITPMVDPYFESYEPEADDIRRGNVMARQRMIVLYDLSQKEKALVIGTGNRTEMLLGYSTLFGDSAYAVNPLGDMLKTQVWQLADYYGLPAQVISKAPSADLWEGQTDEDELGIKYRTADIVITLLVDQRIPAEHIPRYGIDEKIVKRIATLMKNTQFKRMPPLIAKLGHRTVGRDFRYPRDWGL
jgi:NAD+ synthase